MFIIKMRKYYSDIFSMEINLGNMSAELLSLFLLAICTPNKANKPRLLQLYRQAILFYGHALFISNLPFWNNSLIFEKGLDKKCVPRYIFRQFTKTFAGFGCRGSQKRGMWDDVVMSRSLMWKLQVCPVFKMEAKGVQWRRTILESKKIRML